MKVSNKYNKFLYILSIVIFTNFSITYAQDADSCSQSYQYEFDKLSLQSLEDTILAKNLEYYFFSICDTSYGPTPINIIEIDKSIYKDSVFRIKSDNDYEFELKATKFNPGKHKITKAKEGWVCLIDGKIFFGTDGRLPDQEIKSLKVKFKNHYIGLPVSEYKDLYEPRFDTNNNFKRIFILKDIKNKYFILLMYGSDAAGSYTVVWIFKNGKYLRRVVYGGEC